MTLTEASYWTRRFGVLALIGVGAFFLIAFLILSFGNKSLTADYLTPNYACTNTKEEFLPNKLSIPSLSVAPGSDSVYALETQTGQVDNLPRVVNVFKYNILGQALDSQGEAKLLASKMGFNPDSLQRIGTTQYGWTDSLTNRKLVIEARNLNFVLTTNFTVSNSIDTTASLPSDPEAINLATDYLRAKGLMYDDLLKQQPQLTYIHIQPDGSFTQANSKANAQLIRVDFYRKSSMISVRSDIQGAAQIKQELESKLFKATTDSILTDKGRIDVYDFDTVDAYANPYQPNIMVYVGPANKLDKNSDTSNRSVYAVNYRYWPLDPTPCGTYQLIPPSTALEQVQKGKGSLVYLNDKNGDDVVPYTPRIVRKFTIYTITIGYYESQSEQKFLQPIYIISGEATFSTGIIGQFHYYIPAIDYNSIQKKVVTPTTTTDSNSAGSILGN
ncbi:MAG TPA: hypothetical protein VHA74_02705 [Candidatus Dojkabacteria bacterium]|nr:hypothetical protein [Candidatus Dojkabacteria bacterium]